MEDDDVVDIGVDVTALAPPPGYDTALAVEERLLLLPNPVLRKFFEKEVMEFETFLLAALNCCWTEGLSDPGMFSLDRWPHRSWNLKPKEAHSFSINTARPSMVR